MYMYIYNHYRRYTGLVDCALYFTHTHAEHGSSSRAAVTLLLAGSVVRLVEGEGGGEEDLPLANVLSEAQLNGIPIDTVVCITLPSNVGCQLM